MIGRILLRAFGVSDPDPAPAPTHGGILHKDPVSRYLDGQISAEEMERLLDQPGVTAGMPDVLDGWRP